MAALSNDDDRGRPDRVVYGFMALPVVAVLIIASTLAFQTRVNHLPLAGLALFTGLLSLVPLILDQGRPPSKRHVFLTLISLSWGVAYALPVFTYYLPFGGYTPSDNSTMRALHPRDLARGQAVVLLAYLMLISGYSLPLGRVVARMTPRPRRDWPLAAGLLAAVILIPLGWFIYLSGQFGLLPLRAGSGALGVLASSTIFGIALLALLYMRFGSRIAYLMLCGAIPPTMIFNFFTGSKGLFFAPLAMVPIAYVVVRRRFRVRWLAFAVVAFSLFYPVAQFYREVVLEENTLKAIDVLGDPQRALRGMSAFFERSDLGQYTLQGMLMTTVRFDSLSIASKIIRDTPERVPFQNGRTIGYIFISYIPRVLWPGKPEITVGQWVTDNYTGVGIRSNTGPSWIGEFYFNYGLPGVIIGMFLLGIYFRALHETVLQPDAPLPAAWFAVIAINHVVPAMGSGLVTPINVIGFYGGFVLLVHIAMRFIGFTAPFGSVSTRAGGRVSARPASSRRPTGTRVPAATR